MSPNVWIKALCEGIGTFLLVLIGTGSIVLDQEGVIPWGGLGISLCFGGIVALNIILFGNISGAHLNPAVSTLVFWRKGIRFKQFGLYLLFQCVGALLASLLLKSFFPINEGLGATLPHVNETLVFALEFGMTLLLLILILALHRLPVRWHRYNAYWIGLLIFLEAYFGGPYTGASMNPARSLGPALVSGNLSSLWIYIIAPMGAVLLAKLIPGKR